MFMLRKKVVALCAGDHIVWFYGGRWRSIGLVSELRHVRDGYVHVDLDDGAATMIYASEEMVHVACDLESSA